MTTATADRRRARLQQLADGCLDIYNDDVSRALDGAPVPRYALLTSEGSYESGYRDNPNLTVHDTVSALAEQIAADLEEGWPPREVIDLDTGADVNYTVRVDVSTDPE